MLNEAPSRETKPEHNRLLAAFPEDARQRLFPRLETVSLVQGDLVHAAGSNIESVYFPIDAIVSVRYTTTEGASCQLALIGYEGLVGVSIITGNRTSPQDALVLRSGLAYRLTSGLIRAELSVDGPIQKMLLRYLQASLGQMAQFALCNRYHSIDHQLCCCLLLLFDRAGSDTLFITQEALSNLLGVRREGITEAAGRLQRAGIIHYRRGQISVVDRVQLESQACECYGVLESEFNRLLPPPVNREA